MVDLLDGYVGSSCVIKAKNNDLISMGVLHRIGKNFIDVSSSRNELPGIPYNLLIKLEIYNTQLGFKVLLGRVYLSSPKLVRIVELSEATNDERPGSISGSVPGTRESFITVYVEMTPWTWGRSQRITTA